jgi:acetyl-CoA carboxylase/biotin carboxylase 1
LSNKNIVQVTHIEDEGESRYQVTGIIGEKNGIGIENLKYAAMAANETAKAYDEIVTISMVSSRTVGIGSNIVQTGSRIVQIENSYLISHNFNTLNKHLGHAVYSSNLQIGSSHLMDTNGIAHKIERKIFRFLILLV